MTPFVLLVGPPGAGTSTVARELAAARGLAVVDTERVTAEQLGHTDVATAFVVRGEDAFRAAETQVVLALLGGRAVPGDGDGGDGDGESAVPEGSGVAPEESDAAVTAGPDSSPVVVALGSGALTAPEVRDAVVGLPLVQLTVSLAHAAPRLGLSTARPVFLGNPRAQWARLAQERRALYDTVAVAAVDTDDRTPAQVAADVVRVLEERDPR
ncbi:shikimate kinase [Miniimonas arenae]|uniref:Shikimate kinase n=1 Tax=Miniimonas arenae TaxID=676201 RepID=A0A5C5BD63_9MICO|nr:shikimate kinase [Miniimonas arenae]TNU75881.1 shikimate kinase [Miniimonas arenae]